MPKQKYFRNEDLIKELSDGIPKGDMRGIMNELAKLSSLYEGKRYLLEDQEKFRNVLNAYFLKLLKEEQETTAMINILEDHNAYVLAERVRWAVKCLLT